jgi:hypothetical protein
MVSPIAIVLQFISGVFLGLQRRAQVLQNVG